MAKKQETKAKSKAKPKKKAKVEKVEEGCGCGEVHEDSLPFSQPIQLTEVALTVQAYTQTALAPTQLAQNTQSALAPTYIAETIQAGFASTLAALTAQAPTPTTTSNQPTSTLTPSATATVANPNVSISNKLNLPVKISIDKVFKSDLDSGGYKTFVLDSYPVTVSWSAPPSASSVRPLACRDRNARR